jgi:hypothetical protein
MRKFRTPAHRLEEILIRIVNARLPMSVCDVRLAGFHHAPSVQNTTVI